MGRVKQKCLRACAKCVDSHHHGLHTLKVSSGLLLSIHLLSSIQMILLADREGPDQTALERRLIWAFSVRMCSEGTFSLGTTYIIDYSKCTSDWFLHVLYRTPVQKITSYDKLRGNLYYHDDPKYWHWQGCANSADPDQTPQNAASDLGLR